MIATLDELVQFITNSLQTSADVRGAEIDPNRFGVMITCVDFSSQILTSTFLGDPSKEPDANKLIKNFIEDEQNKTKPPLMH